MDRFVSTFVNKIDAKGRVSVPASFRAVLERDGYAGGIYCILRSMLRRSMQAARDLRRKSMASSRICQTIRMSGTSCLSRSTETSRSSRSTATDASCFLKGLGRTQASQATLPLSVLEKSFRCGSRRNSKNGADGPAQK